MWNSISKMARHKANRCGYHIYMIHTCIYMYIHTHRAGRIFRSLLVRFCDRFSQFQKHKNHLKPFPWWPWLAMALVSNHPYIWRRFRTKESSSLTLAAAFFVTHHDITNSLENGAFHTLAASCLFHHPTPDLTADVVKSHFLALSFTFLNLLVGWGTRDNRCNQKNETSEKLLVLFDIICHFNGFYDC